jgi:UDP-N-acetylmuramate dehydrogenase
MERGVAAATGVQVERNVPIPTWFGVGGAAERLARPETVDDLRRCLEIDPGLKVLGDGANLLVDDAGVGELVVSLAQGEFSEVTYDEASGRVTAGAGVNLPKLVLEAVRRGLGGLEGLGGVPASVGGAAVMNAGGTFAQICDVVARVEALDRSGAAVTLERKEIDYSYRRSGLNGLVITRVEFRLRRDDAGRLRARLKEVMSLKKKTQPLGERSAGCAFRNPTLKEEIPNVGVPGARVSAGLLIDRAGGKGMRVGGAQVSERHANFITAKKGCTARDVMRLMEALRAKVRDTFGVTLEEEVVVWRRA